MRGTGTALDVEEQRARRPVPVIPVWMARTLYVVAAVFALAALVVDVVGVSDWKVDDVALGLIGVLLIIPLLEQIQKLKFGSMEAEFRAQLEDLEQRVVDVREFTTRPEKAAEGGRTADRDLDPDRAPRIKRIVWVDDHPENNRLEVEELRRLFDVTQVRTTEEGLAEVSKSPADTAVITDAAREEGHRLNREAGLQLIRALGADHPGIPVYVYCGPATVAAYGGEYEDAGARLVTSSATELTAYLRRVARDGDDGSRTAKARPAARSPTATFGSTTG